VGSEEANKFHKAALGETLATFGERSDVVPAQRAYDNDAVAAQVGNSVPLCSATM
jgi:hypothetical protein